VIYVQILPGRQKRMYKNTERKSNQAIEVIRRSMSVGDLAKKSDKERLIEEDAQEKGGCLRRRRRRRRRRRVDEMKSTLLGLARQTG
jgi:hypothetical protein